MKKIIFISLLLPFISRGQGLITTSGFANNPAPPSYYVGYTYLKNSFVSGDISAFAANTNSATLSGSNIATTGAATDFSAFFTLPDTIRVSHVKIIVSGHMTTTQSSSFQGWSVGLKGVNSVALNSRAVYFNTSTSNNGHIQMYDQNQGSWGTSWGAAQNTAVPNITNDRIVVAFERSNNTIHITARNITQNSNTWDTIFVQSSAGDPMPNTAVPCVWTHGGNMVFDSIAVYKEEPINPLVMFVGDSKGVWNQSNWQLAYPVVAGYFYDKVSISQGFGDRTADMLSGFQEVKAIHPYAIVYEGGSNDIRTGVSNATFQANVNRYRDSCTAYGIQFIALGAMFESAQDMSAQVSFFSSFPKNIFVWDVSQQPGFLGGDGIHLTDKGATWIARRIRESNWLPGPTNRFDFYPQTTPFQHY